MKARIVAKEYVVDGVVINTSYDPEFGMWTAAVSFAATQGGLGFSEDEADRPAIGALCDEMLDFLRSPELDWKLANIRHGLGVMTKAKREALIGAWSKRIQNYGDDRISCELPYSRGVPEDPRHIAIALLNDIFPPF